jgi:hypothetical protein
LQRNPNICGCINYAFLGKFAAKFISIPPRNFYFPAGTRLKKKYVESE